MNIKNNRHMSHGEHFFTGILTKNAHGPACLHGGVGPVGLSGVSSRGAALLPVQASLASVLLTGVASGSAVVGQDGVIRPAQSHPDQRAPETSDQEYDSPGEPDPPRAAGFQRAHR